MRNSLQYISHSADIDVIVNQIVFEEPLISESKKPHLRRLIYSKSFSKMFFFALMTSMHLMFARVKHVMSDKCQFSHIIFR